MADHEHDHDHDDHDHDDDKPHTHEPLYRAMSLIGARMCLRCGSFVSGLEEDLRNHNTLHGQLDVLVAAANPGDTPAELKKTKKAKKHAS